MRRWRVHRRTDLDFADLARMINPIVRGWMNYYGAFYPSALSTLLARINTYLMRWVRKKYKRLRAARKARARWEYVTTTYPRYFAHWAQVPHPLVTRTTEPCNGRLLRTVLWEPGGEIPPGYSTLTRCFPCGGITHS